MELPDVGIHCSFQECKRLDFLPVECRFCKLHFCKEHANDTVHSCTISYDKTLTKEEVDELGNPASYNCSIEACKNRELTPILCDKCKTQFCLKHRLPVDHECTANVKKESNPLDLLTTREKVEKITGKTLNADKNPDSGRVGKRSKKTSNKVLEMKLKMKAKGEISVPIDERVYFNVKVPEEIGDNLIEYPIFYSRQNTIGKMIDLTAKFCNLKNENHIANAPKLRFHVTEGNFLPTENKVSDLLTDDSIDLNNFGEIYLSYVSS